MQTFATTYRPEKSVSFGNVLLLWGADRAQTRSSLNDSFEIADVTIDLTKYNNDDSSQNVAQRRDIYKNYRGQANLFFLNFDQNDQLAEIEIHQGFQINIQGVNIDFSMNITEVVALLGAITNDLSELAEGEYISKQLRVTIASEEALGGESKTLAYFYCAEDVSHLTPIDA